MSNILIIKHGSLGDIVQISGILRDIREFHKNKRIFLLTTLPYINLLKKCPYVDEVLLDKRLPRWNIFYLLNLRKMFNKYNFTNVYDLQNSSRTLFYKNFLLNSPQWCSAQTALKKGEQKSDFKNESVLKRFVNQLKSANIKTIYSLNPDFSWAVDNIDPIIKKIFKKKYVLIFPFCSPQLSHKKWPYFNELIELIKKEHSNIEVAFAPAYNEMESAKNIKCIAVTNNLLPLNIMELTYLIKKSNFVIANDTGPAHIAAHLGCKGLVLFGPHTTPKRVSIETDNFKAITVDDLKNLKAEDVYLKIRDKLLSIN